jgi:3-hydroxyisobutyrate dehydrogenase-like beta-hydroxyacid dehydrogenase
LGLFRFSDLAHGDDGHAARDALDDELSDGTAAGIQLVDAPVSGGAMGAEAEKDVKLACDLGDASDVPKPFGAMGRDI